MLFVDYYTPYKKQLVLAENLNYGFEASYTFHFKEKLCLYLPLKFRSANIPSEEDFTTNEKLIAGLDVNLKFQFFKQKNKLIPFVFAGAGSEIIEGKGVNFGVPTGLGLDIKIIHQLYLQVHSEYRISFSDDRDNLIYGTGLKWYFGKTSNENEFIDSDGDGLSDLEDECPFEVGTVLLKGCPDSDLDGVIDKADKCPNIAGLVEFEGCPDTDGDGIPDANDECPTESGAVENNGCPDADGDGLIDKNDDCPEEVGLPENKGCPDSDQDGLTDNVDRCPTEAGPIANKGCPELSQEDKELLDFAVQNVRFENGKATLISESFLILDKIVAVMKKYPAYKLTIAGHTDSVGNASFNQILSEHRAKACLDYLAEKGINPERMDSRGYGETQPIASNKFAKGRDQNRRVEFNIYLE